MALQIVTVPCLSDNYAYLARDEASGITALIDAPEAEPILAELDRRGWGLDLVLITHHHDDHVAGLPGILAKHKAKVVGHKEDAARLPALDIALGERDTITIGEERGFVIDVSGHTIGHIAYVFDGALFSADSLMALGCGRVFEGTMPQMWESLGKMAQLPPDTLVYSGHEYTESNAKFALTIEPSNEKLTMRAQKIAEMRQKGMPTVPSLLRDELATNPFLRAGTAELAEAIGMQDIDPVAIFTEIRRRKDNF